MFSDVLLPSRPLVFPNLGAVAPIAELQRMLTWEVDVHFPRSRFIVQPAERAF